MLYGLALVGNHIQACFAGVKSSFPGYMSDVGLFHLCQNMFAAVVGKIDWAACRTQLPMLTDSHSTMAMTMTHNDSSQLDHT